MKEIKRTFTMDVKDALSETKIVKGCCKRAYSYGKNLFKEPDFSYIDREYLKCPACAGLFLRGVFVSCGSVNSPEKERHLEMKTDGTPQADELAILLAENGFDAKISKRRNKSIVYFKDGDTIFGFLSFIGAQKIAFDFLEVIIEKQVRNDCNRKINFETANMQKTANAGKKQLEAINYFQKTGKFDTLSDVLRTTAVLKIENPDLSLEELASLHTPPISKSCVNHRLNKIIDKYKELSKKK